MLPLKRSYQLVWKCQMQLLQYLHHEIL